jgi:hypothetical protein
MSVSSPTDVEMIDTLTIQDQTPLPDTDRLERARERFRRWRHRGVERLPDFVPADLSDVELTGAERAAACRAVATPDVCMIAARGPSAERIARAVGRAASLRGDRALLIAPPHPSRARADELFPLVDARNAFRWWTPAFWRCTTAARTEYENALSELSAAEPPGLTVASAERVAQLPGRWDRLIVLNAPALDDDAVTILAGRADRWVFIGDPDCRQGWWSDLWDQLADIAWVREGDRLRCRLRRGADRATLVSESVIDAPEIELRIGPAAELAEVVFPAGTSLFDAKTFLAGQLDESPIDLDIASFNWSERDGLLCACGGCAERHRPLPHELEPGVRELIAERPGPIPGYTCGFQFDGDKWDRPSAERWLRQRFPANPRAIRV